MQRKIWLIVGLILGLSGITLQAKSVREHYSEFINQCAYGQCDNGPYSDDNNYYKQGERYNIYSNTSFKSSYRPERLANFINNGRPHAVIFAYPAAKFICNQDIIEDFVVTTYWHNKEEHHLGSQKRTLNGQLSWLETFFQDQTPHPNFIKSRRKGIVFIDDQWLYTKFNQINLNDPENFFRLVEKLADIVSDALADNENNLVAAKIAADRQVDALAQRLTYAQSWQAQQDGVLSPDEILNPGHDYRCRKVKNYGSDDELSAYPQKTVAESAPEKQSLLRSAGAGSVQQSETKLRLGRAAITACQKTLPARHWQSTENLDACSPTVPAVKEVSEISFESPLPSAPCTETDDEDINQR